MKHSINVAICACVLVGGLLIVNVMQSESRLSQGALASVLEPHDDVESAQRPTHRFDRQWLLNRAEELSKQAFSREEIPDEHPLSQLSYDDYKKIQTERGSTIWSKEDRNFRVNPLHPGFLFKVPVKLNLVVDGISRRVLYTSKIYNYEENQQALESTQATGYSGFNVTHPINTAEKWDEFMVFQGGTYFRAVGMGNWYGLSARGLALNTARAGGEEFPIFREFWIERPTSESQSLVVHALMDSPSIAGAYTFTISPGKHTKIEVMSTLFPRRNISNYGIAPLTSMFLFNGMDRTRFDDFRPAVHDSDGLMVQKSNGEVLWRPLSNPQRLQLSVFRDERVKGFGLLQRSREFVDFQDMEALYHQRPSAWVIPQGKWGSGHVELVEIPTDAEIHDNIVAFFQPDTPLKQGQAREFNYTLLFGSQAPIQPHNGGARIVASRAGVPLNQPEVREFVVDYAAEHFPPDLQVNASASDGNIVGTVIKQVPQTGNLRVVMKFKSGGQAFSELRMSLMQQDEQWGETWLYRLNN